PGTFEHPVEQDALVLLPKVRLEIEGGPGSKRYEVDPTVFEVVDDLREERDARSESEVFITHDVELVDILSGDVRVRADVDDVDALDLVPQVIDRSSDHPACHKCLAKPHLIGDEEAARGAGAVEPLERVVHGQTLEALELREDAIHVGTDDGRVHRASSSRACQIGFHTSSSPSGS